MTTKYLMSIEDSAVQQRNVIWSQSVFASFVFVSENYFRDLLAIINQLHFMRARVYSALLLFNPTDQFFKHETKAIKAKWKEIFSNFSLFFQFKRFEKNTVSRTLQVSNTVNAQHSKEDFLVKHSYFFVSWVTPALREY